MRWDSTLHHTQHVRGTDGTLKFRSIAVATAVAGTLALGSFGFVVPAAFGANTPLTVEDAILYPTNSSRIEYNVTHAATSSEDIKIVDETGSGIDSLDELNEVMGTPEEPSTELMDFDTTLGKAVDATLVIDDQGTEDESDDVVDSITITDVRDRPIVGISWKKDSIGSDYQGFSEAFERNGANAVFLAQVTDTASAQETLGKLDGIFMTGGEDWNPALYGEEPYPHGSVGPNDARDTSDIALMQQAIALDVPMMCVCRGEQGLNVAMGGALIQDIPTYLGQQVKAGAISEDDVTPIEDKGIGSGDNHVDCNPPHYRVWYNNYTHSGGTGYHPLPASAVRSDSKWLKGILGDKDIAYAATAHHQAVDPTRLGDGITIAAMTEDGIVEAIEHKDSLFALALQWHPERDALEDTRGVDVDQDTCNDLLRSLVHYAGVYDDRSNGIFTDVDANEWYADVIAKAKVNGLMNGIAKTSDFAPLASLTRAEAVCALHNLAGNPASDGELGFTDTDGSAWYAKALTWAETAGVVHGYDDGSFHPDQPVTREEFATMLANYARTCSSYQDPADDVLAGFGDASTVSDWATEAVSWAVEQGILGNGGYLAGTSTITRAETASMLVKYAL